MSAAVDTDRADILPVLSLDIGRANDAHSPCLGLAEPAYETGDDLIVRRPAWSCISG
ncbi:hypothetical protein [Shinella sp.]|uniref:hypothetical protein n=1 Tax=Shinella sp. TaxID=1870904 RepID=UPI00301DA5D6